MEQDKILSEILKFECGGLWMLLFKHHSILTQRINISSTIIQNTTTNSFKNRQVKF